MLEIKTLQVKSFTDGLISSLTTRKKHQWVGRCVSKSFSSAKDWRKQFKEKSQVSQCGGKMMRTWSVKENIQDLASCSTGQVNSVGTAAPRSAVTAPATLGPSLIFVSGFPDMTFIFFLSIVMCFPPPPWQESFSSEEIALQYTYVWGKASNPQSCEWPHVFSGRGPLADNYGMAPTFPTPFIWIGSNEGSGCIFYPP